MKGLVIYSSKYGSTQQYADYISLALSIPIENAGNIHASGLASYDYLVIGSPVYIGKLLIKKWLKKNLPALQNKKLFFFLVCATEASERQKLEKIIADNIPPALAGRMELFYLRGRMIRSKLNFRDGILLKLGARANPNKEAGKRMLQDFDGVRYAAIEALTEAVQRFAALAPAGKALAE